MSDDDVMVVTGASRGFGRAVADAACRKGRPVVGVARDRARLEEMYSEHGPLFTPVVADVADPALPGLLIDRHHPRAVVLAAGATPLCRPLDQLSWQTFSRAWDVDVAQVFHWTREALLRPLDPGSVVVSFSSGAAIVGSPLSGGYSGAKATIRFISAYAAAESDLRGLGITFRAVLPGLNPGTDMGRVAVEAYARRRELATEDMIAGMGAIPSPEDVARSVLELVDGGGDTGILAFSITEAGLAPL